MQAGTPQPEEQELYDGRSVMINTKALSYVRTIMTVAVGFAAGILGLTGWKGFAFFVVCYVCTSAALLAKMGMQADKYVPKQSNAWFLADGLGGEALAFVLYWTLMYALVHIY